MCSWSLIVLSRDTYERELMAMMTTSHVWSVEWCVGSPTVSHLVYPYLNLSSPQVTWSYPPPPQHSCSPWHLHLHPAVGATTVHGHASCDCIKKVLEPISGHYSHHALGMALLLFLLSSKSRTWYLHFVTHSMEDECLMLLCWQGNFASFSTQLVPVLVSEESESWRSVL